MIRHLVFISALLAGLSLCAHASAAVAEPVVCVPAAPKKPGPGPRTQPPTPAINAICTPVINIGGQAAPIPIAAPQPAGANPPSAPSNETFKFRIKDVLEAELTSNSRYLIIALLVVFIAFAIFLLRIAKTVTSNARTWIVPALAIAAATLVTCAVLFMTWQWFVQPDTVDVLTTTLVRDAAPAGDTAQQLALLRDELRELGRQPAPHSPDASILQSVLLAALLLGLGTAVGLMGARAASPVRRRLGSSTGAQRSWPGKAADEPPLPLHDLYRLEALVTHLRGAWPGIAQGTGGEKPRMDVNEFLRVMTRVRGRLEGAPPMDERDNGKSTKYRIRQDASGPALHQLDDALAELEHLLLARHDTLLSAWRTSMGKALARLQHALITVCEPYKYELPAPGP